MLNACQLDRKTRNYAEILDVIEYLAITDYGSGPAATSALIRRSPLFIDTTNSPQFKAWLEANSVPDDAQATAPASQN